MDPHLAVSDRFPCRIHAVLRPMRDGQAKKEERTERGKQSRAGGSKKTSDFSHGAAAKYEGASIPPPRGGGNLR